MKTARAKAWRRPRMVMAQRLAVLEEEEEEETEEGEEGGMMMMGLRRGGGRWQAGWGAAASQGIMA